MKRRIHFLLLALLVALFVSSSAVPLPAEASSSGNTLEIVSVKSVKAYVYAPARYTSKKIATLTKGEEYPWFNTASTESTLTLKTWISKTRPILSRLFKNYALP